MAAALKRLIADFADSQSGGNLSKAAHDLIQSGLEAQQPGNMLLNVEPFTATLQKLGRRIAAAGPVGADLFRLFCREVTEQRAYQVMGARFVLSYAPVLLNMDSEEREAGHPRMIHKYLSLLAPLLRQPPEPDPDSDSD